jgi:NADH-quinone oxidoreductase subunit N
MWAPDVYDGAPTPVTGFMATGVKTAGFVALVRILSDGFPAFVELWQPALAVLAILSIVVGNIVALAQTSMKRLLAYSSIAHAGYLLVAVWAASPAGHMAVLLYLWAYSLTSLAAFGVVAAVEHVGARTVLIEDLEGLFRSRPWAALSLSVCLLSLLGFPGTFGFIGKWLIMSATLDRSQVVLPVLVGLGSLVSLGYYLPVIMAMTMKPERSPEAHRQVLFSQAGKLIIAAAVAAIIFLGIWPRIPLRLGRATADSMTQGPVVAAERP